MSKTILLIVAGILVLGTVVFGIFFLSSRSKNELQENIDLSQTLPVEERASVEKIFSDESGFSFKYPASINVADITPNDSTFYTLLDLSKADKSIKISVKDASLYNPPVGSNLLGAITLAGMSAKQYSYKRGNENMLLTVAIDKGVLYIIEGLKDAGFWEETQNTIVSSFSFAPEAASGASSGGSDVVYEGEEVVE